MALVERPLIPFSQDHYGSTDQTPVLQGVLVSSTLSEGPHSDIQV